VYQKFQKVFNEIIQRIIADETANIKRAALLLSKTVMEGGTLYTFGTGHSLSIALEAVGKRGSLIKAKLLDEHIGNLARFERLEGLGPVIMKNHQLNKEDTVIVASNSGRNPLTIEVAEEAKRKGAKVITISAHSVKAELGSLRKDSKYLSDFADVAINNHGDSKDLLIEIPRTDLKVGSPSTLTGIYIYYLILIEAIDLMLKNNFQPPLIKG